MTEKLSLLIKQYFNDSSRTVQVKKGSTILKQGDFNDKLFYIKKGLFIGFVEHNGARKELFRVSENQFLGLYSFFSGKFKSSATVVAEQDSVITYIDEKFKKEIDKRGEKLFEKFMPIVVENLLQRQKHELEISVEKEVALKKLKDSERLASLGQMAAGIAHELNNAIAVLERNSAWVKNIMAEMLERHEKQYLSFYKNGAENGRKFSSRQVRERAKNIAAKYAVDENIAEKLAQTSIAIESIPEETIRDKGEITEALKFWEIGAAFYDVGVAARHAAHVVKSVRALAEKKISRRSDVDVNETINQALSLLSSPLREIDVKLNLTPLPNISANRGELVQVWLNIVKNGIESMSQNEYKERKIKISSSYSGKQIVVDIADNGPGIPKELLPKIWQPDVTTKEKGIEFGLGLGLTIVERIVKSYSGEIKVQSRPGETVFIISLPVL